MTKLQYSAVYARFKFECTWIVLVLQCYKLCWKLFTGSGTDYDSGPYFVTFRRGSRRATFVVNIIDDNWPELDENFNLTINATSLPFGVIRDNPYSAIVTIVDDECK